MEFKLLIPSNEFAKIYIYKYNKCAEIILSFDFMLHLAFISDQIQSLLID